MSEETRDKNLFCSQIPLEQVQANQLNNPLWFHSVKEESYKMGWRL